MNGITLEWFFKLPGLFITCGVLLILIALLVFIISGSKARKQNAENNLTVEADNHVQENNDNQVVEPIINVPKMDTAIPTSPVNNNVIGSQPINTIGGQSVDTSINPVSSQMEAASFEPIITPIGGNNNEVASEPIKIEPVITPVTPQTPEPVITPVTPQTPEPVITPVTPQTPEPVVTPVVPQTPEPVITPVVPQTPEPVVTPVVPQTPEPVVTPFAPQTTEPSVTTEAENSPENDKPSDIEEI